MNCVLTWSGVAAALIFLGTVRLPDPDRLTAAHLAAAAFDGPVRARVVRIVDGDTFEASAVIWLDQAVTVRVRIDGIDAPELNGDCAAERDKAAAARAYLEARIGSGEVLLSAVSYDKYGGRVRARVADGKGDIGEALVANGLARPYRGGRRPSWCAAL